MPASTIMQLHGTAPQTAYGSWTPKPELFPVASDRTSVGNRVSKNYMLLICDLGDRDPHWAGSQACGRRAFFPYIAEGQGERKAQSGIFVERIRIPIANIAVGRSTSGESDGTLERGFHDRSSAAKIHLATQDLRRKDRRPPGTVMSLGFDLGPAARKYR